MSSALSNPGELSSAALSFAPVLRDSLPKYLAIVAEKCKSELMTSKRTRYIG